MERINTEVIVSSLISIGFEKVDSLLFTYTLAQLTNDNSQLQFFKFEDYRTHDLFNDYIEFKNYAFQLKEGYTLDTKVPYNYGVMYPLKKVLHTNKKLIEYLSQLDFKPIIAKKIETLKNSNMSILLSNKEQEIMNQKNKTK